MNSILQYKQLSRNTNDKCPMCGEPIKLNVDCLWSPYATYDLEYSFDCECGFCGQITLSDNQISNIYFERRDRKERKGYKLWSNNII